MEAALRFLINDNSFLGWTATGLYLVSAFLCFRLGAPRFRKSAPEPYGAGPWLAVGVAMLLLGTNKQLDLQNMLRNVVRVHAREHGWYDIRRTVQLWVLFALTIGVVTTLAAAGWRWGRWFRRRPLLVLGLLLLAGFVLLRASSAYHALPFIGIRHESRLLRWVLELGGICCVIVDSARRLLGGEARGRLPEGPRLE